MILMTNHLLLTNLEIFVLTKFQIVMETFHLVHLHTSINVPPPGEIQISGTARINAFDNNFITFDSSTETFDETVHDYKL